MAKENPILQEAELGMQVYPLMALMPHKGDSAMFALLKDQHNKKAQHQ